MRPEMDFGDLSDNPFAVELSAAPRRRAAVISAAKFFVVVGLCFAAVVVVGQQTQRWLVYRLTHDFEALSADEKRVRMVQIADLGELGIEPLVHTLNDKNPDVARTAFELLRDSQNGWSMLRRDDLDRCHEHLIRALSEIAIQLPDDRTGWGTSLLQQTIMEAAARDDASAAALLSEATRTIDVLALSERSGPSILEQDVAISTAPRRLSVPAQPLPVSSMTSEQWVQWPPTAASTESAESASDAGERWGTIAEQASALPATNQSSESPSLYRASAARLAPVDPHETVLMRDIDQPQETAYLPARGNAVPIQSAMHLVDSPMETFSDQSVMQWLGSGHEVLREKAQLELIARGYDSSHLTLARQVFSEDVSTRLAMVDAIARSSTLDPRPWLLMMLDDEDRKVKLRVVSVLATMDDPAVARKLQMRLSSEQDPTVAHRIRRVLKLR